MQITNVMKYHYAKAVVFSFFSMNLLTLEEYQSTLKKLAITFGITEESNDKK